MLRLSVPLRRRALGGFSTTALLCDSSSSSSKGSTSSGGDCNASSGSFLAGLKQKYDELGASSRRALDSAGERLDGANQKLSLRGADSDDCYGCNTGQGASSHREHQINKVISANPFACPRTVLFVPASKPRALQKIHSLHADCFILDMEDSVGPSVKREARENLRKFVAEMVARRKEVEAECEGVRDIEWKRLVIRINSPDYDPRNAMLDLELVGLLGTDVEGVAIPKVTSQTYDMIKEYLHPDHQLWAFFETPQSVVDAAAICARREYKYAVMGYNDLAAELQLPVSATSSSQDDDDKMPPYALRRYPLLHCASQVVLAARAANMHCLDGVYNDPTDTAGFRRDLQACRSMGFNGKTIIHPSQIAPTHEAYTPTEQEVQWAHRIKEAVDKSHGGVVSVDGKMVEELHVRQANRMLTLHASVLAPVAEGTDVSPKSTPKRNASTDQ